MALNLKVMRLAVAAAAMVLASGVQAATIPVWNDTDIDTHPVIQRGSVNCSVACEVLNYTGAYSFSAVLGELFNGPSNSGDASEAAWVNSVIGTSFSTLDVTNGKDSGTDSTNYITNALYVVLKIGRNPDYTIIKNTSGVALTWSWDNLPGSGGGLSHYIDLGTPSEVPLPAGGLLLMGALGGLAALRRRRSA